MTTYLDYMISPLPIRVYDPKVDKSKLRVKSLRLVSAGHLPGRTLQRDNAVFIYWAFVYIAGGSGYYKVGEGEKQPVQAGSLFCFYPGEVFQYGPDEGGDWEEYYFNVEGARIEEWLANWVDNPAIVRQVGRDEAVLSKLERIFTLVESGIPVQLDQAALLLESVLFEWLVQQAQPTAGSRSQYMTRIIDDLSDTLYEAFDADKLAKRHHISVSTLRRIVESYTGYPLGEYMHRLRISESKRLLLNTDWSVKEISERLDYKDPFYFSRVFKRLTGYSPKRYRDQIGQ
ncbi:AraC-like DNA-binding protein [Paenibacillus phyllosphaerae]|uniref:AraC-like DNA-binding protein n=1 Tax=Paenibacillus phyllosphaerae TaxID=274593 RepID=A0A7W5AYP0_9BACL|nr:AraC family transcriptional regulator [Paenibacillus phyllosphaerae]MBB3111200.1 AraC-like DNA-binding protein [Paenibacillus phyllosphaerae]